MVASLFMHYAFTYTFLFIGARLCGLCFHQLGALESILSLKHHRCFPCFSSPCCSILVCLGIWICTLTILVSPYMTIYVSYALFAVAVMAAVLTFALTTTSSCLCGDQEASRRNTRGAVHVLAVAVGTLWLYCMPLSSYGFSYSLMSRIGRI